MELSEAVTIAIIVSGFALLGSVVASGVQVYKWLTGEKKKVDTETDVDSVEAALILLNQYKIEFEGMKQKNEILDKKFTDGEIEWQKKFDKLSGEYTQMQSELSLFKDWAQRLVFQIQAYGEVPVPMIKKDYSKIKRNGDQPS